MIVTFLVAVRLDDLGNLTSDADAIDEAVSDAGFEVLSVAPWQRPSLQLSQQPTTQQPTTIQNQ